jgi:hypothetical protein
LTRRSFAEPKNLRASAPIMPNSYSSVRQSCREVVRRVTYQLIVTRYGPALTGDRLSNKWEIGNPGFNGKNAAKLTSRR